MQISTTHCIEGKTIVRQLGLVRGNTIRARHIGQNDIKVAKEYWRNYRENS